MFLSGVAAAEGQKKCKFERLFSKVKKCRFLGGTAPGDFIAASLTVSS